MPECVYETRAADGRDVDETVVIFRVWRGEGGGVFALFPELPHCKDKPWLCQSYEHVGQHGAADYGNCIGMSRPAKPAEYAELLAELSEPYPGFGYRLLVRQKETQAMRNKRRATAL